jgi:predicted phage tail component-like protein
MSRGYTVTYDGIPSTSLTGFICHEVSRNLVATRRTGFEDVPGMEGSYVFPEEPGMREIELDCSVLVDEVNATARRAAVRQVASWFNRPRPKKLIISDEPDVYEMAIPASAPDVTEWRQLGQFPLPFVAEPYSYQIDLQQHVEVAGAGADTFTIDNDGDVWTPFIIQVRAASASTGCHIEVNGRVWEYNETIASLAYVTFNTKAGVITNQINYDTDLQGIFLPAQVDMNHAAGRPPYLEPGINEIDVSMSTGAYTVTILWRGRYS